MSHAAPAAGAECQICCSEIERDNYVEYQESEEGEWKPATACEACITYLQQTQWVKYVEALEKADCAAARGRLLAKGVPLNVSEPICMPCGPEGKGEVYALWFASGNDGAGEVRSAQLLGALVGEARDKFKKDQEEAIAAVAIAEAAAAPAAADPTTTTTA